MPQTAQYKLHDVFESAIPLVLKLGYRGCSMDTLINVTDFNRRAFYIHFENKQKFIEALLKYYLDKYLLPLQEQLANAENKTHGIISYFKAYQDLIDKQGCLLVRLVLEMAKENDNIQSIARHFYDNLQLAFIANVELAITKQQLAQKYNAEQMALKLCCIAQGMAVSNNITQGDSDALLVIKSLFDNSAS